MTDAVQLDNVRRELGLLLRIWDEKVKTDETVKRLHAELREVNEALWDIEDRIRDKEREQAFDEGFVELARSVYVTNDRRARVKKALNRHLGSKIVEEKSYRAY